MRLKSGKLTIRNATTEDAEILCRWWNDGAVMAHAGFPNGLGTSAEKIAASLKQDTDLHRRLILELEGVAIGEMNYRTTAERTAEIGIKICDASQQDRGHGTTFIRMLIDYLFEHRGYDKIALDTNLKNERAQHVYEKLGFRKTATRMNSWKNQLGELQSAVEYELLKED
jgi:RimJ/RimL family protein N-acetyltransferase